MNRRKSLLPAGITAFYGDFESGDVVDLLAPNGRSSPAGFVGHDAAEMPGIIGRSLSDLPAELRHPVVHADDLIAVPQLPSRQRQPQQPTSRTKESDHVRASISDTRQHRRSPATGPGAGPASARPGTRCSRPPRRSQAAAAELALLTRAVKDRALLAMADALLDRRDGDPGRQRARRRAAVAAGTAGLAGGPAAAQRLPGRRDGRRAARAGRPARPGRHRGARLGAAQRPAAAPGPGAARASSRSSTRPGPT